MTITNSWVERGEFLERKKIAENNFENTDACAMKLKFYDW